VSSWIKYFKVEFATSFGDDDQNDNVSITALNVSNWLTVIILHSLSLIEFSLTGNGVGIRVCAVMALVVSTCDSLMSLNVTINPFNVEILHFIPRMTRICSLGLYFRQSRIYSAATFPPLLGVPPLLMPSVQDLIFVRDEYLYENDGLHEVLRYLSMCRFSETCRFDLDSRANDIYENEFRLLDPLFLHHHSACVRLRMHGDLSSPTVFQQSQIVEFDYYFDELFHERNRLPPLIVFHMRYPEEARSISIIVHTLATNTCSNYDSCIQIVGRLRWAGDDRPETNFAWDMAREHPGTELGDCPWMARMHSHSLTLATKGITMADSYGMTRDMRRVTDVRLVR
jgi:hypothetical protein